MSFPTNNLPLSLTVLRLLSGCRGCCKETGSWIRYKPRIIGIPVWIELQLWQEHSKPWVKIEEEIKFYCHHLVHEAVPMDQCRTEHIDSSWIYRDSATTAIPHKIRETNLLVDFYMISTIRTESNIQLCVIFVCWVLISKCTENHWPDMKSGCKPT